MIEKTKIFTDLIVWQKAHEFVLQVYKITSEFPKSEIFGLTSQFRRAAISIPANIAEGYKKRGHKDKLNYLNIAQGSLEECRYYLILTNDLNFANTDQINSQLIEVSKLLTKYSDVIRNSNN
ncbi:MAG: four helix bundle protein [Ignavibacteriae bacterium]|nr:four helix bundle protein [Ignavibacteriota bacterium]